MNEWHSPQMKFQALSCMGTKDNLQVLAQKTLTVATVTGMFATIGACIWFIEDEVRGDGRVCAKLNILMRTVSVCVCFCSDEKLCLSVT